MVCHGYVREYTIADSREEVVRFILICRRFVHGIFSTCCNICGVRLVMNKISGHIVLTRKYSISSTVAIGNIGARMRSYSLTL